VSQQKIEIILGEKTLKIACPAGEESALIYAAEELNKRLIQAKNTTVITTPEQTMLMTALNLSNDLLQTKTQLAQERKENQSKIELLKSTIKSALLKENNQ
jgi:cell division protein ZapA